MARFDNKLKVSNELDHSLIDKSFNHITTTDFNVIKPVCVFELVPGDKVNNFHLQNFTRLLPLNTPTFGRVDLFSRAFFVPYRIIEPSFNDVYNQQNISNETGVYLKSKVDNSNLGSLAYDFIHAMTDNQSMVNRYGAIPLYTYNSDAYDFSYVLEDGSINRCKLTVIGKRVYDLLCSLGYVFNLSNVNDKTPINYLALRAWVRLFYDWFLPSQFADKYRRAFEPWKCNLQELIVIMSHMCYRYYNDDVFSASMEQPFLRGDSSRPSVANLIQYDSNEGSKHVLFSTQPSTGLGANASSATVNGLSVETVEKYTRLVQRHNLITHRISDLFYAKFGVRPDAVRDDITEYLGQSSQPVQISDVMATGENVGDYAGKGISSDETGFHYSSEEFGLFMVISEVVPKVGYGNCLAPHVQRVEPYDFFTPEFDGLGFEPISFGDVNKIIRKDAVDYFDESKIFGFLPRYALGYKSSNDCLTGDFKVPTLKTGLNAFHLLREFDNPDGYSSEFFNDEYFRYTGMQNQEDNFDRIFVNTDRLADHFITIYAFDIQVLRPMLAMSESWMVNSEGNESRGSLVENGGNI